MLDTASRVVGLFKGGIVRESTGGSTNRLRYLTNYWKELKWVPDLHLTLKLGMDSSFVLFCFFKCSPGGGNIDELIM